MIDGLKNIALVTPLKDEIENIEKFIFSISSQTTRIKCLIILENDSIDGSKEYLDKISEIDNVDFFEVINISFDNKEYNIEHKYSSIISKGFNRLKDLSFYNELDYIGILDSDCFPEPAYYEKLIGFMDSNLQMGISSGIIYTPEGKLHIADPNWVRGGCRIWNKKCLDETGFPIEPSPDAITVALAHIAGWETETLKSAHVISREVNERLTNYENFGKRAYYRGHSTSFALLKFLHFAIRKRKPKVAIDYIKGYFGDLISREPRIANKSIRNYYKYYLLRGLTKTNKR